MNSIIRLSSSIPKIGDCRVLGALKNIRLNNGCVNHGLKLFLCDGDTTTTTKDTRRSISLATSASPSLPKRTMIPNYFFLKQAKPSSIFKTKCSVRRSLSTSSRSDSRHDNEKILVKDEDEDEDKEGETSKEPYAVRKRAKDHEGWKKNLQELILYKEKHGDCLVPMMPGPYHKLGDWVDRQRQQYRILHEGQKSNMTDYRIDALERIGFVWNFYDQRWEVGYDELVRYREKYGNCLVPLNVPEFEKLWNWVFKQKRHYSMRKRGESSPITDERIERLEKMGFIWDLQEDLWTMRYVELVAYKANNGGTIVPR